MQAVYLLVDNYLVVLGRVPTRIAQGQIKVPLPRPLESATEPTLASTGSRLAMTVKYRPSEAAQPWAAAAIECHLPEGLSLALLAACDLLRTRAGTERKGTESVCRRWRNF